MFCFLFLLVLFLIDYVLGFFSWFSFFLFSLFLFLFLYVCFFVTFSFCFFGFAFTICLGFYLSVRLFSFFFFLIVVVAACFFLSLLSALGFVCLFPPPFFSAPCDLQALGSPAGVSPEPLGWECWVQDAGLPENSWPQGILIGESSPGSLHLNSKTWVHPTACRLQCWMPHAKQQARQEYKPTH